jgi:DNA repair exonuclease SbcCD nuclease subunit
MFRFVHAADIHLDSPLRGLESYPDAPVEQVRGAARRAFDNLVNLAIEEEVAFVLLAGDLFDGDWKDYNTGLYFTHRMGRLRERGIRVFLVSGNHDAASQLTRTLRLPDNVILFPHRRAATVTLDDLGAAVHGQSFGARIVSEDLSREYPPALPGMCNIGLLHTSLTGRPNHESYAPCSAEGLASRGYDYWALGHVHKREVVGRHPWIVFPGNIQGRHIRETGPKGCAVVTVESGRVSGVEFRDLDVLRFEVCRVDLTGCVGPDGVRDRTREALDAERGQAAGRPLAVRVILEGCTELHSDLHLGRGHLREELRALAADLGDVWLEKLEMATRPIVRSLPEEDSPLGGLEQAVADLELHDSLLGLAPEFENLRGRLPAELLVAEDPFCPDAEGVAMLRDEVRELLMARLQEGRHAG